MSDIGEGQTPPTATPPSATPAPSDVPNADASPSDATTADAARRKRTIVITAIVATAAVVALVVGFIVLSPRSGEPPTPTPTPSITTTPSPTPSPTPTPTPTPTPPPPTSVPTPTAAPNAQSIDDPASYWVVVNKLRPLNPGDYEAADLVEVPVAYANQPYLRQVAADAVVAMFAAFTAETGLEMQSQSAYRSYSSQESVYAGWVASLGQEAADLTSARPGHSEHQTGLAIDVSANPANCSLEQCFADTAQGQWLAANGWRFGFIVRYPNGKTDITGYVYEPWHMRYVGPELAADMHNSGVQTLEEQFGLPAAPGYAG